MRRLLALLPAVLLAGCLLPEIDTPPLVDGQYPSGTSSGGTSSGGTSPTGTGGCPTFSGTVLLKKGTTSKYNGECMINGTLEIYGDAPLTDVQKLKTLTRVQGNVRLLNLQTDLTKYLSKLDAVTGDVEIENFNFTALSGFQALLGVGGKVAIQGGGKLYNISGFANLLSVKRIDIVGMPSLTEVYGFAQVDKGLTHVNIADCANLAQMSAFGQNFPQHVQDFRMSNLPQLGQLPRLVKTTSIGFVQMKMLGTQVLDAFPALQMAGTLRIESSGSLQTLEFPQLGKVAEVLFVFGNPQVQSLAGLDAISQAASVKVCANHPDLTQEKVAAWAQSHGGTMAKSCP